MENMIYGLGVVAALLTSLSYLPQVRKAIPRGSTHDLSLKTLSALSAGLALWIAYGIFRKDYVIVGANIVGFILSATLVVFVLRDRQAQKARTTR
jgi:MtN3 and saliva related transmembrane protein